MTTMANVPCKCSVCGGTTEFPMVTSTNAFGSPDLDLRPPEMRRSTMPYWVQSCPHCGYAAASIDRPTGVTRQWLSSAEYASVTDVTGDSPKSALPSLAKEFYMAAKCHIADGAMTSAVDNLICAAWDCDDVGDEAVDFARRFRILAADLTEECLPALDEAEKGEEDEHGQPASIRIRLRLVDILRRAGEFDRASARCSETKRLLSAGDYDRMLALVAAYEQDLIDKGDIACHTMQEALEAEASLSDIIQEIRKRIRPQA